MEKNKLYTLLAVVLVLVGVLVYLSIRPEKLAFEKAADLELSEISFEGRVVSIQPDQVIISTGKVERTDDGNQFVEYEKVINFADEIKFVASGVVTDIKLEDLSLYLQLMDRVVFYGSGDANLVNDDGFIANRIEFLSRGI